MPVSLPCVLWRRTAAISERPWVDVCACVCVYMHACSAAVLMRDPGCQVLVLWEKRWVTVLMNSDVRHLLINQETVRPKHQPPCSCMYTRLQITHTNKHGNVYTCRRAHVQRCWHHLHLGPWCLLQSRGQCLFPLTAWAESADYPACSQHPRWAKSLTKYANTCQMYILNEAHEQRLQTISRKMHVLSNQIVVNLYYTVMTYFPTFQYISETRWHCAHVHRTFLVLTGLKMQIKRAAKQLCKPIIDPVPPINITG